MRKEDERREKLGWKQFHGKEGMDEGGTFRIIWDPESYRNKKVYDHEVEPETKGEPESD